MVQRVEGEKPAAKLHVGRFFDTSAKTGQNMEDAFFDVAAQIGRVKSSNPPLYII